MDPDLVRQQAEEEAASRLLSRRDLPPDKRVEPVLPMGTRAHPARRATGSLGGGIYPRGPEIAVRALTLGWGAAVGIAASATLGTIVGIVGGMMLGVKLQLVPLQTVLIGATAGLVLGWQVGALALIQRAGVTWWRAYGVAIRAVFVIVFVLAVAMFVAPHFIGAPLAPNAPFDIAVFWKSVAAGAAIAVILGAIALHRALRLTAERS